MAEPKADKARCDVFGCGNVATVGTTGAEEDAQKLARKAVPNVNVCARHTNWPHSDDARAFATTDVYRRRTGA